MSTRMRLPDRRPCETFQLEVANPDDRPTCPDQPNGAGPGISRWLLTECQQALGQIRAGVVDKLPELLEILREEEIKYALRQQESKK